MIDTHCHLDVAAFDADRDQTISRATAAGVTGMLIPAIRPRTWPTLVALARQHAAAGVRCALGIHPQIVPDLDEDERHGIDGSPNHEPRDATRGGGNPGRGPSAPRKRGREGPLSIDALAERIASAVIEAGAVAVGECGLDGATAELELQERIFRAHIRAARALDRPLLIHVLRAHDAAPRILREEGPVRGVLHSYSGGAELVGVYAALGLAFSFAGPVTYPNARRPVEAARRVPAERLLAETDAPDQAPEGHRGGRSEPAFLPRVIAGLAAARGEAPEAVAARTTANAQELFGAW